jgi:hypothetical protein
MRQEEVVVVAARSAGDVVLTTFLRAHGPSSWVGVHPRQDPVLWVDLLGRTAGTGEALDAPATEAEVVAAGAAVAVGDNLEQEDRALVHDGDDRDRDAASQAWRKRLSAELMTKVRQIKDGNAEKSLKEEEKGYGRQYQL